MVVKIHGKVTHHENCTKKGDIVHVISKAFDAKSWRGWKINDNYGLVPKLNLADAFEFCYTVNNILLEILVIILYVAKSVA